MLTFQYLLYLKIPEENILFISNLIILENTKQI